MRERPPADAKDWNDALRASHEKDTTQDHDEREHARGKGRGQTKEWKHDH